MRVGLGSAPPREMAARRVASALAWEAPRLPRASETKVPRWVAGPTWTPPGTILLVRHRALDGGHRLLNNDRTPPAGYAIEFDLGLVHAVAQPGTARLVGGPDGLFCTPFEGQLDGELRGLGYVEQAPLPLLESLELRRVPETGQVTLVAGVADPLWATTEPVGRVGFIEGYPINPREVLDARVDRGMATLLRHVDEQAWRHRYESAREPGADAGVALGGLWCEQRKGTVELLARPDGSLTSALLPAAGGSSLPAPKAVARWVGAPLNWTERRPRAWALKAGASRARHLAATAQESLAAVAARRGARAVDATSLGWLQAAELPNWSPLFSARHPVLGDQYLTRSELEARDMGYAVEGVIGWVADWRAGGGRGADEVKWASHFGQRRRYVEGPVPG